MGRRKSLRAIVACVLPQALRMSWQGFAPAVVAVFLTGLGVCAGSAAADGCPNAPIRAEQNSEYLPDCRAYEQVSPVDKNGTNVFQVGKGAGTGNFVALPVQMQSSGDGAVFGAIGSFAGSPGLPTSAYYAAFRTSNWATRSLTPPQAPWFDTIVRATYAVSPDLSKSLVFSKMALTGDAVPDQGNLYLLDNRTGSYALIASSSDEEFERWLQNNSYVSGTSDFSHILFTNIAALTPDATAGESNLYEFSNGTLRLVNAPGTTARAGLKDQRAAIISPDGERVFFNQRLGANEEPLYMREGSGPIVPVSVSHRLGDSPDPVSGALLGVTDDASSVYFTSQYPLTDDAVPIFGPTSLYRYDAASAELTNLTPESLLQGGDADPEARPFSPSGASPISGDGSYLYFSAGGRLTPDAPSALGMTNLYLWRDGVVSYIASTPLLVDPSAWTLSPDGTKLAFLSSSQLTSYDNSAPASVCPSVGAGIPDGLCNEVYLYDAISDELVCASCDTRSGRPPTGHVGMGGGDQVEGSVSYYRPDAVTDAGEVFFDTPDRLVSADNNGKFDVYEYRDGEVYLISTGAGRGDTFFHGATLDGRSVFFTTGDQLAGQDRDNLIDLYVARVEGGLTSQARGSASGTTCQGDTCQGPLSAPPSLSVPASGMFEGRGNVSARKKTPRKKHGRRGKVRHKKAKAHGSGSREAILHSSISVGFGERGGR